MYHHVARLHLDLVQLWRCPIAWCTTSGHNVPWVSKTASIEKYAPPWTVRRQLWTDSLRIEHSGISTDMLLFSEVGMPLTQHYRVYKGGLPHAVFRTDYMARLRSLLPSPEYWLEHMGRERTVQAALRLHHDASLIMTNVQIMSQLVTSFSRTASEVMRTVYDREPFPTIAVDFVKPGRRVRRAAHYMATMSLWRPTSAPVFPGPISASSCNSCMACEDCFPDGGQ